MKKLVGICLGIAMGIQVSAQEAADKKIQAGLIVGTGINFQRMGTKQMSTNGVGADFNIGANLNFGLNDNIAFTTGLELDFSSTRFQASALTSTNVKTDTYYQFVDSDILNREESATGLNTLFRLDERKHNATYLTIPTMLLFRTKYIGYFRYFGKFGLRNSILVSNKITDQGEVFDPVTASFSPSENARMEAGSDLFFYKGSVGLAAGAEWNFSGSTVLAAELGFYYGFTPLYFSPKEDKRHLYSLESVNGNLTRRYFNNDANQSQLMLKVSILF